MIGLKAFQNHQFQTLIQSGEENSKEELPDIYRHFDEYGVEY